MANEHEGVSPASAGGAPAPDPNAVDNAVAGVLIDQYGFLPLSVRFSAAAAARAVTESSAQSRPVPNAEILPADRKPVLGEPGIQSEWDEDTDAMRVDGIGWDLSWGCKLSLAYDHERGEHYVCVSTSDQDQRAGITTRRTTKEQIALFGQQLLNVFGEPDPRDAEIKQLRYDLGESQNDVRQCSKEIERLRAELAKANSGWETWREEQRAHTKRQDNELRVVAERLHELVGDTRPCTMDPVNARHLHRLLDRVVAEPSPEIERLKLRVDDLIEAARIKEQRGFDAYAEMLNPIREVFGKRPVAASHYRELRDAITRLIGSHSVEATRHEQAKAERDRLRADLARERAIYADSPDDRIYHAADNTWWRRNDNGRLVEAEKPASVGAELARERAAMTRRLVLLRQDFTAAVNGLLPKPAKLNGEAACRAGNEDYSELSCTLSPGHAGSHRDRAQGAIWSRNMATPAEPRRFYAHSPEPEVDTVVGLPDSKPGGPTWTRHPAGGWQRSNSPGYRMAWKSLFGDRGELVEVPTSTTDEEVPF